MGRKALPPDEKARRRKESKKAWREREKARKSGVVSGASWLKDATRKLESAASSALPEPEGETPSERPGEPFADLPPLDIPAPETTPTEPESAAPGASEAPADSATSVSPATAKPDPKVFDTETIQKMAYGLGVMYMEKTGAYCKEHGFFAFDETFAPMVGMACQVLVKKNAEKFNVDDEEGAAYVVGIFGGVNGVQAIRAKLDDDKKKKTEKVNEQRAAADAKQSERHVNGVTRDEAQQQTQRERDLARDDAAKTGGLVV